MRQLSRIVTAILILVVCPVVVLAQSTQSDATVSVPRLITITGVFRPADGQPLNAVETVTLSVYAEAEGGAPVWQETQTVTVEDRGRYSVLLGASRPDGIPADVFTSSPAHWLGTRLERPGEVEGPRTRLTSVPYAIRAADADTLGGRPASEYLRAPSAGDTKDAQATAATAAASNDVVLAGTANFLAKYVNTADVGTSGVFEAADGAIGLGTTTPFDRLHVRYNNNTGDFTGLAVQNTNGGALAYSGMLFFDHTNALTQFQGYNNATHEYRINNIARVAPGGAFNGSINFMLGGTSKFFIAPNGNIGIGTTAPAVNFEVSNALSTAAHTLVLMTSYGNNSFGSATIGRKARGTAAAPTAVQDGDELATFGALGYGATAFSALSFAQGLSIRAAQNWTDTAQATSMFLSTTSPGTVQPLARMTITATGDVGVGTTAPSESVEVVRAGQSGAAILATTFGAEETNGGGAFVIRNARGTGAAPAAVHLGDSLGYFVGNGYGTSGFGNEFAGGMVIVAGEDWTDAAQGSLVAFITTPLGSNEGAASLAILPDGKIGIGTFNAIPTIADKLQVFGDIRVGTTGTNGCLKNFTGTGIAGTCSSDRRLKKNITPFGPMLDKVTALEPVHYFWRTSEFPDRHFGNSQNYGLIAQDVEQVLPELVATDSDGYKAVDYSQLPLLAIQAIKELKAQNDARNTENDALKQRIADLEKSDPQALKQRVSELERLVAEMFAATRRQ
jgi:hypothetical protein